MVANYQMNMGTSAIFHWYFAVEVQKMQFSTLTDNLIQVMSFYTPMSIIKNNLAQHLDLPPKPNKEHA